MTGRAIPRGMLLYMNASGALGGCCVDRILAGGEALPDGDGTGRG